MEFTNNGEAQTQTKIKLCGLTREEDIRAANALAPAYVGFVFAEKSRRYVSPQTAARLKALLAPGIRAVGVFVNAPVEAVAQLLEAGTIDIAQLHGAEDEAYIAALRARLGKPTPILQAFRIETEQDVARAARSTADCLLVDHGPGGTGEAFDWALLRGLQRPYFLAGGLTPENVATAVRALHPYAVDVSSGIETAGKKDPAKMRAFCEAVRG
jgi:phosphoribosylanthranilate isomerase